MILDLVVLPFKVGFKAVENQGNIRINMTLYDTAQSIIRDSNKEAILEEDYMDARPSLHTLKQVKKQAVKLCSIMIGRRRPPHLWLDERKEVGKRIKDAINATILEEKIKQERLLSKFKTKRK